MKKNYIILAIETSCDETSCAVVKDGRTVLSNVVSSQIDIHTLFGGVVPEVASRNHVTAIDNVVKTALQKADITLSQIDAIAVTYGAGLQGALLVGVSYAKALAFALNKPLMAVNHILGHLAGNYITYKNLTPPFICLLVSGGHTAILNVKTYKEFSLIGETLDDAVGECFDKIARVLELGYPGGPKIQQMAKTGKNDIKFGKISDNLGYNFSFSGKKTAVINYINTQKQCKNTQKQGKNVQKQGKKQLKIDDICASFQHWCVNDLVTKTIKAATEFNIKDVVLAGGVSANLCLREMLKQQCEQNGLNCFFPELQYCTDNAAMIGSAAYYLINENVPFADNSLSPNPSLPLK